MYIEIQNYDIWDEDEHPEFFNKLTEEQKKSYLEALIELNTNNENNNSEFWEDFFRHVSSYLILPESFMEKYVHDLNWLGITTDQPITEAFIEKYADKIVWEYLAFGQHLSEAFIEKYTDKLNWEDVALRQKLSKDFIIEHVKEIKNYETLLKNEYINKQELELYNIEVLFKLKA